jgi:Holliday junction resolvase RusA-like endonuclease
MTALRIVVYGDPAPQGSKSGGVVRGGPPCPVCHLRRIVWRGKPCPACKQGSPIVSMHESSKAVSPWRKAVSAAARQAVKSYDGPLRFPLDCPVAATMVFTFGRNKGDWGTGRNAGMLRASAPYRHIVYPDLSKLARATEDALTGIVWADDARVCDYTRLAKVFAGEDDHALDQAGALILVGEAHVRPATQALPLTSGNP